MVILERTHNLEKAKIIVSFLQANDIDAELLDGAMGSVLPGVSRVRIAVPEEQKIQAERLLAEAEKPSEEN